MLSWQKYNILKKSIRFIICPSRGPTWRCVQIQTYTNIGVSVTSQLTVDSSYMNEYDLGF